MVNKKLTIPELKKLCEDNDLEFNNKFKKNDYIKLLSENNIISYKNKINLQNDELADDNSQNDEIEDENSLNNDLADDNSQNDELADDNSQNDELADDNSQNDELADDNSQNDELADDNSQNDELANDNSQNDELANDNSQNDELANDNSQNDLNKIEENKENIIFLKKMIIKLSEEVDNLKKMVELSNNENILDENILKGKLNEDELNEDELNESSFNDDSFNDDSFNDDSFNEDEYEVLNNKKNLNNEVIELGNNIYSLGIRFKKVLDTNCLDNNFVNFLLERGYECKGLHLNDKVLDNCEKTDINISNIDDNSYDIVFCINLFQYLDKDKIKTYYGNLIRITSEFIIIKFEVSDINDISKYLEYFNEIVSNQDLYKINRYITDKLPKNVFILKKELINK